MRGFVALSWGVAVLALGSCSTLRTVEYEPATDWKTELARAIRIVEQSVPVPDAGKYRVAMVGLPEGTIGRYDATTHTIQLNSGVKWAVWEKTGDWETREVFDPASVMAHEIACFDPDLPLQHHPLGWLTGPEYQVVRRINKYDRVEHNGAQITVREAGICALVQMRGTVEVRW